jgi:hypothetical protein
VQIDQVSDAGPGATAVLRDRAEMRLVADRHRRAETEPVAQLDAERLVDPAHVRPEPHHPVRRADHAAVRRPDTHPDRARRRPAGQLPSEPGQHPDHRFQVGTGPWPDRVTAVQDDPAEPDPGRHQTVHRDIEGQHVHPIGFRPDHQRRPPDPAGVPGRLLDDQPGRGQLRGQRHDRAAVETHPRGQLRAGQRAGQVEVA